MKFSEAKLGMLVSVMGEHSLKFPNGAIVTDKDSTDSSIKIKDRKTGYELWFFEPDGSYTFERGSSYSMKDIHPFVEDIATEHSFRKLPPNTLKMATYLGLDAKNVTCYVDKENGTVTVRQGDIEAKATKAPKDTWDFRLGMGLALCRLKEQVSESKKIPFDTPYFYVMNQEVTNKSVIGITPTYITDDIRYAMGNVFHTLEEAKSNCKEMARRSHMIVDFCKKQGW